MAINDAFSLIGRSAKSAFDSHTNDATQSSIRDLKTLSIKSNMSALSIESLSAKNFNTKSKELLASLILEKRLTHTNICY